MPNPLVPNYVPGVGQLVTYRSDFESHVTGTGFRHDATMIDMNPTITIVGHNPTTVQDAIVLLNANLMPTPPQATIGTSVGNLGIITLGGDLAGTALIPKVIQIQGIPVISTPPSPGQVLTYNMSGYWGPANQPITFGGDLVGAVPGSFQSVIGLTGTGGIVHATANTIQFATASIPSITQVALLADTQPQNLTISTQEPYSSASTALNRIAGSLVLNMTTPWTLGFYGSSYEPAFEVRRVNNESSSMTDTTQGVFAAANLVSGISAIWVGQNALPPTTIPGGVNYQGALGAPAVSVPNTLGRTAGNYTIASDASFNVYLNAAVTDNSAAIIMENMTAQLLTVSADAMSYTTTHVVAPTGNLALSSGTGAVTLNGTNIALTATSINFGVPLNGDAAASEPLSYGLQSVTITPGVVNTLTASQFISPFIVLNANVGTTDGTEIVFPNPSGSTRARWTIIWNVLISSGHHVELYCTGSASKTTVSGPIAVKFIFDAISGDPMFFIPWSDTL